jgi:hypothetical protein
MRDFEMRHAPVVFACLILAIASGCATGSTAPPASQAASSSSSSPVQSEAPTEAVSDIVGFWHRAQSCQEMLAAFERVGLAESHREWLQGNFYGGEPGPESGDPCAGAEGPLEHSHWLTADGEFGSHDQNAEVVDGGDYEIVDADTLSFPSHATEFGYSGEVLVDYEITDGIVTFNLTLPEPCDDRCRDAYGWAHSAFASGPWAPGDVP